MSAVAADGGAASLRSVSPNAATGTAGAVVVSGYHLAHTAQVVAVGADGKVAEPNDAGRQTGRCLELLDAVLKEAESGLDKIVKLHICVAKPEHIAEVQQVLSLRFSSGMKPAVTFVVSTPPHPDALVAMDAVGATEKTPTVAAAGLISSAALKGQTTTAGIGILPAKGRAVYVAGQSAAGDLAEGTRRTLDSLRRTLEFLALKPQHVVQLKAFMAPITQTAVVQTEIAKFFGTNMTPPIVFVEWTTQQSVEIELIATTGDQSFSVKDNLNFVTPHGMVPSPLYSRVAVLNHGPAIYVGGLHGAAGSDPNAQVREVFGSLEKLLREVDGNLRHLAKATYYVSDEKTSSELNALRPGFLDPKRPPAASKAMVRGIAPGRTITIDMIAAPIR